MLIPYIPQNKPTDFCFELQDSEVGDKNPVSQSTHLIAHLLPLLQPSWFWSSVVPPTEGN